MNTIPFPICFCRNKLKEEIKANTLQNGKMIQPVYPIKHVSAIRQDGNETKDSGGNFQQMLDAAKKKSSERDNRNDQATVSALVVMGGMNQYNKHAQVIFYSMNSNADYKC